MDYASKVNANDPNVQPIPRLKNWVATYYPGLQTAITECNWGAEGYMNGANTQADIWGIFGREGLDLATRWTTPASGTPTYQAMKMFRNYDGNKSTFGDVSVATAVPNPDNVSSFSAQRSSDGALTVMVISKVLSGTTPVTLSLANFTGTGAVETWQLTGSSPAIQHLPDSTFTGTSLTFTAPAQSITLLVFPTSQSIPAAPGALSAIGGNSEVSLSWPACAGAVSYIVSNWRFTTVCTDTLPSATSLLRSARQTKRALAPAATPHPITPRPHHRRVWSLLFFCAVLALYSGTSK